MTEVTELIQRGPAEALAGLLTGNAAVLLETWFGKLVLTEETLTRKRREALAPISHRYVEELGGMNLFFVYADGRLVTPELTGTILPGVTRSSLLELARERGMQIEERRFTIDEWRDGVREARGLQLYGEDDDVRP